MQVNHRRLVEIARDELQLYREVRAPKSQIDSKASELAVLQRQAIRAAALKLMPSPASI